jgi:(p)ppGpp synthase/HD superfamily hydrolase
MIGAFDDATWSKALSLAFRWHAGQTRKNSGLPYVIHCIEVAANLERLGFAEPVVIAGLLHDILEDTEIDPQELRAAFGPEVHEIVAALSETKADASGSKRPWIDRKRDHIRHLRHSNEAVRGVALADQRQNLDSVLRDWKAGDLEFWSAFNASPGDYLGYHRRRLAGCRGVEPGVRELSFEVSRLIEELAMRLDESGLAASTKFADSDWA